MTDLQTLGHAQMGNNYGISMPMQLLQIPVATMSSAEKHRYGTMLRDIGNALINQANIEMGQTRL